MQINLLSDWQKEALCVNTVQLVTPVVWSFCPLRQKYTQLLCRVQAEQKVFQQICIAAFASICLYFGFSTYLCTHAWTQISMGQEKDVNKGFFFLSQTEHIYSTSATPLNFQFSVLLYQHRFSISSCKPPVMNWEQRTSKDKLLFDNCNPVDFPAQAISPVSLFAAIPICRSSSWQGQHALQRCLCRHTELNLCIPPHTL